MSDMRHGILHQENLPSSEDVQVFLCSPKLSNCCPSAVRRWLGVRAELGQTSLDVGQSRPSSTQVEICRCWPMLADVGQVMVDVGPKWWVLPESSTMLCRIRGRCWLNFAKSWPTPAMIQQFRPGSRTHEPTLDTCWTNLDNFWTHSELAKFFDVSRLTFRSAWRATCSATSGVTWLSASWQYLALTKPLASQFKQM